MAVERDDRGRRRHAEPAEPFGEDAPVGQRMAAVGAGLRAGQVVVEVQVDRAGQMAGLPRAPAGLDVGEVEAGVDDERRVGFAQTRHQLLGGDQRARMGVHDSAGARPESWATPRVRSRVANRPAPTISAMPRRASQVTRSSNSSTP